MRARPVEHRATMIVAAVGLAGALACSSQSHAPPLTSGADANFPIDGGGDVPVGFDVAGDGATLSCGQSEDAGILCACTEIATVPPTLYLVLDASGSMSEIIEEPSTSKWDLVRLALLDGATGALRALGSRIAVGAAVFPGHGASCSPGSQVFPVTVGSPTAYNALASILGATTPDSGALTPTAATLAGLTPSLSKLPTPRYVLLATDGAPNCGTTHCTADRCTYDIEGAKLSDGTTCAPPLNCCDPSQVSGTDWTACDDADATKAQVTALAAAGISTFVLGVPGTELYAADLDALAIAGGEPRDASAPTRYYAASDRASLLAALKTIAAKVAATCTITLDAPVSDPGITNVLLDGTVVPQDAGDGWTWTDPSHIELHGASCTRVLDGDVGNVQVAVGCKTVTR
jgi:hypothetical protein